MDSSRTPPPTDLQQSAPPTRGRPRKADSLSPAARAKSYRERQKAQSLTAVKCYLGPEHLKYLKGLCRLYEVPMGDAIAMALTALIRGELPGPCAPEATPEEPCGIILL